MIGSAMAGTVPPADRGQTGRSMCDCLVALPGSTAGGATLFGKNSDRPPDELQVLERYPADRRAEPVRATHLEVDPGDGETIGLIGSRPWWMWGLEHGVNEAGVAIGNETIYTTEDPRPYPPALTGMDLVRLGLERATTAADAVGVITALLERYGQGGTGHLGKVRPYWSSFLIADPTDAWVVETSASTWAAERVTATRAISNRTTIPGFDAAHRHPRQPVETLVDPRLDASRAVLARAEAGGAPLTVADLQRHLRSHAGGDDGWTVCMHVDGVEATTASLVAELRPSDAPEGPAPARFLLGSPCTSIYVPLFVHRPLGVPVRWDRLARLDRLGPEARPALDALEASLEDDARDDDDWSFEAWRRVDRTLAELGG
jgi:dipeptidase